MAPIYALGDRAVLYRDNCWNEQPYQTRKVCHYGPEDAKVRIALVGNSHAGHWFGPLEDLAAENAWSITTYVSSICYPVDVPVLFSAPASQRGCSEWNDWVRDEITSNDFDLEVMSARTDHRLADIPPEKKFEVAEESYGRTIDAFTGSGANVLVIRDTPNAGQNVPDCVSLARGGQCVWSREAGLEPDPLAAAATRRAPDVAVLDVTDVMCDGKNCAGVIGDVIVYFDHGHLTNTFARTLRPWVEESVTAALS